MNCSYEDLAHYIVFHYRCLNEIAVTLKLKLQFFATAKTQFLKLGPSLLKHKNQKHIQKNTKYLLQVNISFMTI